MEEIGREGLMRWYLHELSLWLVVPVTQNCRVVHDESHAWSSWVGELAVAVTGRRKGK